jgi:hypothetical protein
MGYVQVLHLNSLYPMFFISELIQRTAGLPSE